MSIDQLINVQITTGTKTVTKKGFGTALIASYHAAWPNRVREYSDPSEMLTDGFTVYDGAYIQAQAIKSQKPSVKSFKVGRRGSAPDRTIEFTPTNVTEGEVYSFQVAAPGAPFVEISYPVPASATVAIVCAGISALLDAISGLDCSDDTTKFTLSATTAGDYFRVTGLSSDLVLEDVTADPGIGADLASIYQEDPDFYGLCLDSTGSLESIAAASWAESNRMVFCGATIDDEVKNQAVTDCVMSVMKNAGYAVSKVIYHHDVGTTAAAAWLGRMLPTTPGSAAWAYKELSTVPATPYDLLSDAGATAIEGKNGNHYREVGGVKITFPGKVSAGEWTDVVRGLHWTHARIQERVLFRQANSPKVSYTNTGVALFQGDIGSVLREGVLNTLYAANPAPTVTAPPVSEMAVTDRAARTFTGIEWSATLAGAILILDPVKGTVSV